MAWYSAGTVTIVNGATSVSGTGTKFASNARVGDAFRGPDGLWYEVVNIASETTLGIFPAYQSASASGSAAYTIAPMQGYVKESADRLRTITNQYGTTLGLLGSPSDVTALRTNIGAAKSGVNSDITQLSGLTVALSVAQGGTGAKDAAGARTGLGLGTAATATLTTSTSDSTTGRVLKVNDFGFGGRIANFISDIDDPTLGNGWYGVSSTTTVNGTKPAGQSWGLLQVVGRNNLLAAQGRVVQMFFATDSSVPKSFIRSYFGTSVWSDWVEVTTSTTVSSMLNNVGLGITSTGMPLVLNLDDPDKATGLWRTDANTTGTKPPSAGSFGTLLMQRSTSNMVFQTYTVNGDSASQPGSTWQRTYNGGASTWSTWVRSLTTSDFVANSRDTTANKVLTVGYGGLGMRSGNVIPDIDSADTPNGTYACDSSTVGLKPSGRTWGTLVVSGRNNYTGASGRMVQTFYDTDSANARSWTRNYFNNAWGSWFLNYNRGQIVGTVSSNNETSSIIERGSNTNGEYTRFADGTMICWANRTDSVAINTSLYGGFASDDIVWTHPMPFISQPSVVVSERAGALSAIAQPSVSGASTAYRHITVTASATAANRNVCLIAVGRWA